MGICKHHQVLKNATVEELHLKDSSVNCKNHHVVDTTNYTPVSYTVGTVLQTTIQKNELVAVPNLY